MKIPFELILDHVCPYMWEGTLVALCACDRWLARALPGLLWHCLRQYGITNARRPLHLLRRLRRALRLPGLARVHPFHGEFVTFDRRGRCRNAHGVIYNRFIGYNASCVTGDGDIVVATFGGTHSLLSQSLIGSPAGGVGWCESRGVVLACAGGIVRQCGGQDPVAVAYACDSVLVFPCGTLVMQASATMCRIMLRHRDYMIGTKRPIKWVLGPVGTSEFVLVDEDNSAQLRRLDGSLVRTGALMGVSRPVVVGRFLVQDGRRIHVDAL